MSRERDEAAGGRPIYLGEVRAAFVHDTAVIGATSPMLGQRLRLEVEPAFGGVAFADVRVDARRYFMPVRPVTIAARVEHVGRYGPDAGDPRLTPLVLGLQTLVRGYDLRRFAIDECGRAATECSLLDELTGSRFALLNLEVRAPLFGLLTGELELRAGCRSRPSRSWTPASCGRATPALAARARPLPQHRRRRARQHRRPHLRNRRRQAVRSHRQRLDAQLPPPAGLVVDCGREG